MGSVVREVYEALREAGVSEEKAIAVAEALDHAIQSGERIERIEEKLEALFGDVHDLKVAIARLEERLGSEIKRIEAEIRRLDDKIENRFRWVLAVVMINLALTLGVLWQVMRVVGK